MLNSRETGFWGLVVFLMLAAACVGLFVASTGGAPGA
jgi:hypothetical protein